MEFQFNFKYSFVTIKSFYEHKKLMPSTDYDYINGLPLMTNDEILDDCHPLIFDSNQITHDNTAENAIKDVDYFPLTYAESSDTSLEQIHQPASVQSMTSSVISDGESIFKHKKNKSKKNKQSKRHVYESNLNDSFVTNVSVFFKNDINVTKAYNRFKYIKSLTDIKKLQTLDTIDATVYAPLCDYNLDRLNELKWTAAEQMLENSQWESRLSKINELLMSQLKLKTPRNLVKENRAMKQQLCKKLKLPCSKFVFTTKLC